MPVGKDPVVHKQGKKTMLSLSLVFYRDIGRVALVGVAIEIPLLPSFLYLFNEDESLASPCILGKINR